MALPSLPKFSLLFRGVNLLSLLPLKAFHGLLEKCHYFQGPGLDLREAAPVLMEDDAAEKAAVRC